MNAIESYQINRFAGRLHAFVQFILVLLILAAINAIAMRNFLRWDLTAAGNYTLSTQTLAYLEQLDRPIHVIVTIPEESSNLGLRDVFYDVKALLREYEYATRNQGENRITVEYLDVYKQARRVQELNISQENAIIFKSNITRDVPFHELYRVADNDIQEFLGERIFTKSILEVSQETRPRVYFTMGHGELDPDNFTPARGISKLVDELKSRNIQIGQLDLAGQKQIPEDASLILICAPRARFLPSEQGLLKNYLRRESGRVILLLEPASEHGLDDLLFEWGILADDALAVEADPNSLIEGGDMMIRTFAQHPITEELQSLKMNIITDRARSVREDPGRPIDASLVVTELMATSQNSWGEKNRAADMTPRYDPEIDLKGPIRVGAISERKVDSSLGISIPGGRLAVIGTSNFVTNNRIQASGNLFFALNAINYALDRMVQLKIAPRPIRKVKLDLSLEQLLLSRYLICIAPPFLLALFGFVMYLARRQ